MSKHKLDIFDTLAAIDRRDFGYLDRQEDEARKAFAAPVVMRWASAASTGPMADVVLVTVNEKANRNFYDLYEYPDLQYRLLAACGTGRVLKHHWVVPSKAKRTSSRLTNFLAEHWPDANEQEIALLLHHFDRNTFEDFINGCACDAAESKELLRAFDLHKGTDEKNQGHAKGRKRR